MTARVRLPASVGTRWPDSSFARQVRVLTGRYVRASLGDPKLLFLGLFQPVVLFLLFSQVFAGVGAVPGVARFAGYLNFLLPATIVNIALTTAMGAGFGLLSDTYTGFTGRLRTMPVARMSLLVARSLADAIRLALQLVVILVIAWLVLGFRPGDGWGLAAAVIFTVAVGWALSWLFLAIAAWHPRLEAMQAVTFIVMFPLMFTSSAYMPVETMPGWLRVVAKVNPVTYAVDTTRALALGVPAGAAPAIAAVLAAAVAGVSAWAAYARVSRES
ncbi:ABC transporter permease [Amycolatopsis sp. RTGN1]|uniref:ABC transporter permease n=1 Tax=Amycolatopsis ponsaeliensis TaxID=2992142 RepID=UPI002550FE56|nr:ABC transporter permease [Amycolatopsis sp. RTGN1]